MCAYLERGLECRNAPMDGSRNCGCGDYLERTKGGHVFTGSDVNIFRLTAIAGALRFYAKTGMPINRGYTPRNMLRVATQETGRTFKGARKYYEAAAALEAKANAAKDQPRT